MTLENWEIWHNRTSHFHGPSVDLADAARRLVKSGACPFAFHSRGHAWFANNGCVDEQPIVLSQKPRDTAASFTLPDFEEEFTFLCACVAAEMAFLERQTLTDRATEMAAYVRCFFEPILLGENGRHTSLYPIAKIYANGVCTLSLRTLGPEWPTSSDNVLADDLAISRRYFDQLLFTPGLLNAAPIEDLLNELEAVHPGILASMSPEEMEQRLFGTRGLVQEGETTREYFTIDAKELGGYAMLDFAWAVLEGTIDSVAIRPVRLSLEAYRASGEYERPWFSHPTVYFIKWPGQPFSATKLQVIEHTVAQFMTQSLHIPRSSVSSLVEAMPRLFDDYRAYVNEAVSVYAFASQKLEQADPYDTHLQRVVLPTQVNEEMALWLTGSYRSLERRTITDKSRNSFRKLEKEKRALDAVRERISHFGELEDFFDAYVARFKVGRSIARIEAELAATDAELKDARNVRLSRFGVVLAMVFGLIGSGQVADSVVSPLRKSGLRLFTLTGVDSKLSDYLVAVILVLSLAALTLGITRLCERRR